MMINISVQYNDGWASPLYYTVDPRLLLIPLGYRLNTKYRSGFVFMAYVSVYYYYHV